MSTAPSLRGVGSNPTGRSSEATMIEWSKMAVLSTFIFFLFFNGHSIVTLYEEYIIDNIENVGRSMCCSRVNASVKPVPLTASNDAGCHG